MPGGTGGAPSPAPLTRNLGALLSDVDTRPVEGNEGLGEVVEGNGGLDDICRSSGRKRRSGRYCARTPPPLPLLAQKSSNTTASNRGASNKNCTADRARDVGRSSANSFADRRFFASSAKKDAPQCEVQFMSKSILFFRSPSSCCGIPGLLRWSPVCCWRRAVFPFGLLSRPGDGTVLLSRPGDDTDWSPVTTRR